MNRVFTLDYLRGIAALLILIYHYFTWQGWVFDGDHFLGRAGYYGVSIFYILSGLTLYYVYNSSFSIEYKAIKRFFVKRILRIFPLLWLVTIMTIILSRQIPEISKLVLNFSGLFGFFKWDSYIATGAWSIGNELVFYSFFPFLIYLAKQRTLLFWIFGILITIISLHFSIILLPDTKDEPSLLWKNYINPLNQLIFFFLGIAIGKLNQKKERKSNSINLLILSISLFLFAFYPVGAEVESLIMGWQRYIFVISCVGIVYAFYNFKVDELHFYHKPLLLLGEVSYGLYLFHPLVFAFFNTCRIKFSIQINNYLFAFICAFLSFALSYLSYVYFEKMVMKRGQKAFFSKD